jgi:phospholipid/cholesterol/gamma-HCH transport system permease protein
MWLVTRTGAAFIERARSACLTAAVLWAALRLMATRAAWPRTVREQIGKQILFTGYDALGLTLLIAAAVGVSVVAQGQMWLARFGQSDMLGTLLIAVIFREAAPLLVNFLVIARSGTAIVAELATMRVNSQVRALDIQGIDPMIYLVISRVIGMAVSTLCLTIFFIAFSLAVGFLFGLTLESGTRDGVAFIEGVLKPIRFSDILSLLAKTVLPGLVTGVICCVEGLSIKGLTTEVPQAATHAVVRSIASLLVISAVISLLAAM